jgi:putative addiction module CopG family antidote
MARGATINVSLTPRQMRLVRRQMASGHYGSASQVIHESLGMLFARTPHARTPSARRLQDRLAAGYKATAARDRKLARHWAQLPDAWPEK